MTILALCSDSLRVSSFINCSRRSVLVDGLNTMTIARSGSRCLACIRQNYLSSPVLLDTSRYLLLARHASSSASDCNTKSDSRSASSRAQALDATRQSLNQARTQFDAVVRQMQVKARERGKQYWAAAATRRIELEQKLRDVGGSINQATGYEQIDRLRTDVIQRGELFDPTAASTSD